MTGPDEYVQDEAAILEALQRRRPHDPDCLAVTHEHRACDCRRLIARDDAGDCTVGDCCAECGSFACAGECAQAQAAHDYAAEAGREWGPA